MLTHIHIKNFTIVSELNLDFYPGFNVLTGETGAGKSIWIDAVELTLGQRADLNIIRNHTDRCEITLCFDISKNPRAQQWLEDNDIDFEDECIIRRTIHTKRQSRILINGTPCTQALVRELANTLISIHSQHQHQHLLTTQGQSYRLDCFAKNSNLLAQMNVLYQQYQTLNKKLNQLQTQSQNREAELALFRFQLNELEQLDLQENEWETLSEQHQRLHNAKQFIQTLNETLDIAVENEHGSASQLLQHAIHSLEVISHKEPQLKSAYDMLVTAAIHVEEASNELQHFREHLDLSPENLQLVEQRLTTIHDFARKHHVNPENLLDVAKSLAQKIQALENIDIEIETLQHEQKTLINKYQQMATALSHKRQQAANQLNQILTDKMQLLGMKGGRFQVQFIPTHSNVHPSGNETIRFEVITNPGQDWHPLNKIVSGGELSRIGLALQVAAANQDDSQTLIFDEVDVGIGGETAAVVGSLLRTLGKSTQILCITHLPQVAAFGDHHYRVEKYSQENTTHTTIAKLNHSERSEELARMLGGTKVTDQTRAHALELLGCH